MRIGQVAAESGVSIDTIRFYERRGILPAPSRTAAGYRVYVGAVVERLSLAKRLQGLGLTLDEIASALHERDEGHASVRDPAMAARGSPGPDRDQDRRAQQAARRRSPGAGSLRSRYLRTRDHRPELPPRWEPTPQLAMSGQSDTSCAGLMLPPLHMMATFRPANRAGSASTAARAAAPCRLHQVTRLLNHDAGRARNGSSETSTKSRSSARMMPLRQLEGGPGGQALGEWSMSRPSTSWPCLPGPVRRRRRVGLHADHLDRRADGLGHRAGPGRTAAAADRDHDHLDVRLALPGSPGRGVPRRRSASARCRSGCTGSRARRPASRSARGRRRSRARGTRARRRARASTRP